MRLDKWLWAARFFKTRSLAAGVARARKIRLNGAHVSKASAAIQPGDVLTFAKAGCVRVIKVAALSARRGPASEAQTLYEDLSPPVESKKDTAPSTAGRRRGSGRPTKAERRALDRLRGGV